MRRPISSFHPILYHLRVHQRQIAQHLEWRLGRTVFASRQQNEKLPWKIYRHQSKLMRHFSEDAREMAWQRGKVQNHSLAIPYLNGVIIRPKETFSFWKLVGKPSSKRGFVEGMELSQGRAQGGIGGGLCQIGNLIHWLALHSHLEIKRRANHSFDPFPDQGRVIPYGTGAALFYNYIDLWLYNPTDADYQLNIWLTDKLIEGELRSNLQIPYRFRVYAKNERFTKEGNHWFRHNEIWREKRAKGQEKTLLADEKLYENHVRVLYNPDRAHS